MASYSTGTLQLLYNPLHNLTGAGLCSKPHETKLGDTDVQLVATSTPLHALLTLK
jgi:hypothetical protein